MVTNQIRMSNIEDDLIAGLSAIDARREKLREALEKLKTTPQNTKSSLVPDSGVDVGQRSLTIVLMNFSTEHQETREIDLGTLDFQSPVTHCTKINRPTAEIFQKKKIIIFQGLVH